MEAKVKINLPLRTKKTTTFWKDQPIRRSDKCRQTIFVFILWLASKCFTHLISKDRARGRKSEMLLLQSLYEGILGRQKGNTSKFCGMELTTLGHEIEVFGCDFSKPCEKVAPQTRFWFHFTMECSAKAAPNRP